MHLNELKQKPITELIAMAEEAGVEDPRGLRKHELVFGILQARAEADGPSSFRWVTSASS